MNKKAQMELAIIKGLIIALAVVGGFLIYETIIATTPSGTTLECKWDCSNAKWGTCLEGYSYRDVNLCIPADPRCINSEPKPPNKIKCS